MALFPPQPPPHDLVPDGSGLRSAQALVAGDLVHDDDLASMMGPRIVLAKREIPRIRPILVALAARATGASQVEEEAQHAAELLHMALRVHDTALGREGGRRRRVARRIVRRSVGWLSGNHLTLRALELSRHSEPGVLEELLETMRSFADAQALSRELLGALPDEEDWREHADAHTGALFSFCCRAGGHLGRAPVRQLAALGRYGRHMGRLWHVAEDVAVLDHGDAANHLVSRAVAGRPALPVICAAERDPRIGAQWAQLTANGDPAVAHALADRVRALGVAPSRAVMLRESWAARKALRALPESSYRAAMERLAAEVIKAGVRPAGAAEQ